jgi:hypothetical protein
VTRVPTMTQQDVDKAREWAAIGTRVTEAAAYFRVSPDVLRRAIRGEHKKPYPKG